ncbi:MAG: glutathione S-transferase N-terminal domain-containing protein [Ectothiorhodospiraceae bacterium]|nr:glutathione S-transferase N-terminal domain-containing protein [Ectothiorhodospiraceae bacterium]
MSIRFHDLAGADPEVRFSPFCWRVRFALAHKGLAAEAVCWRFTDKEAIAFSGQGKVPVLQDGDTVVSDSWDIALYLEHAYPDHPTLFPDGSGIAHARFVKYWVETTVQLPILQLVLPDLFDSLHEKDKPYFRETREARFGCSLEDFTLPAEKALPRIRNAFTPLRLTLAEQPFLEGDTPGLTDFIAVAPFYWAAAVSPMTLLEPDDPVRAWVLRLHERYPIAHEDCRLTSAQPG